MKSASSYVLSFFPILITCIINYFLLIMMRWYFFTYIYFIHYFIVDTNTWIYLRLFLQSNYCFKWTFGLNVDMRKVWISYNIIPVWCIIIIWFYIVDVWVNISTYILFWNVIHLLCWWIIVITPFTILYTDWYTRGNFGWNFLYYQPTP